jgi:hypothetical protein
VIDIAPIQAVAARDVVVFVSKISVVAIADQVNQHFDSCEEAQESDIASANTEVSVSLEPKHPEGLIHGKPSPLSGVVDSRGERFSGFTGKPGAFCEG